ncbi:MAG TPA: biopolymer transporter ExbD [Pseudomonadota bacterium]|nr:biopolymer transporter ExbD [Pseudomonadota bacterium]
MTIQRLRFRLRKLREHGEELIEETGELNLVPYLDIVMNIIMFLLATVTFQASLSSININLPTSTATMATTTVSPKPELNLTVSITDKGFSLVTSAAVLYRGFVMSEQGVQQNSNELPTIPLGADGKHDQAELTRLLTQIKTVYPAEERAIITATPQIPYELVISTMDAMRQTAGAEPKALFPGVLLGAGVN